MLSKQVVIFMICIGCSMSFQFQFYCEFIFSYAKERIHQVFIFSSFTTCLCIFHKTEVQTVIFRCIVCLNLNWIQSYNIISVKNSFFFMPENVSFQGYFAEVFFDTFQETSSHISIMAIFSKFFGAFMRHIIR